MLNSLNKYQFVFSLLILYQTCEVTGSKVSPKEIKLLKVVVQLMGKREPGLESRLLFLMSGESPFKTLPSLL